MVVEVAEALASLAGALVDDDGVAELMERLGTESVRLLGAQAARLVVADGHGRTAVLAVSAATGESGALLEALPHAGPAYEALRTAEPVSCADLAREPQQWPDYSAQVLAAGLRSVLAVPMRLRDRCLGGLCVYDDRVRAFGPTEHTVLGALASMAAIGLVQHRKVHRTAEVAEQLQRALDARVLVHQAAGVLARRDGVPLDTALDRLRARAREEGAPLLRLAEQVVDSAAR